MHSHRENEKACLEWSWNGVHSGFFMNDACFSFLWRVGDSLMKDDLTVFETFLTERRELWQVFYQEVAAIDGAVGI